tara:strand:- start:20651 stop:21571 length:921 start_codon:yes stop_codon:yes gene_type:complete
MEQRKKPIPKQAVSKTVNRAEQVKRDDNVQNFDMGLYQIDETIKYYFDNVIMPQVTDSNDNVVPVPVIYGSPQRWKAAQKSGFYRDKKGRIQLPLIMYKRTGIEKNRNYSRHFDHANNNLYYTFENRNTQINKYDNFSALIGQKPKKELHKVVVPSYVNLTYECIIWCEFIEQINKVVEAVEYASDSYWGDPERFKFSSKIDSFDGVTDLVQGGDRTVRSSFSINMFGYIIPDALQKKLKESSQKVFTSAKVTFGNETVSGDIANLMGGDPLENPDSVGRPIIPESDASPSDELRGISSRRLRGKK